MFLSRMLENVYLRSILLIVVIFDNISGMVTKWKRLVLLFRFLFYFVNLNIVID